MFFAQHRRRFASATVFILFFSTSVLSHSQDLPKAPNAQVFTLTPTPGFFTEPGIAVNPTNPQQVVAVFQDNAHTAFSWDGGRTWQPAEGVDPKNYRVSGDVSVAFDNQGHAFICYIAFDKLGTFNYWAHGATRNGIFVRRSLDGGKTWEADHLPVAEQPSSPGIPFEDKPYIVADNSKSKYAGNLYIGWTRWRIADSQIVLSRSTDDGKTWSQPVEIDAHPGLPRDDNGAAEGFDGVVAPDGKLYAIWSQDNAIMLTTSRDGGKTFSRARPVIHTAPIMFAIQTLERANGFPQIAIDPKTNRLYVTWSDYRNGDLDVFIANSDNGGKRWTAPVRVNNDPIHNGAEQFFQWLAMDPTDGSIDIPFMIAGAILRTGSRSWCWHVLPTVHLASRTTPGPIIHSKRAAFSSATTADLRLTAGASTAFGQRNLNLRPRRRKSPKPPKPRISRRKRVSLNRTRAKMPNKPNQRAKARS